MLKSIERKNALARRKNNNSLKSSKIVIKKILSLGIINNYNNIGIYYPIGNEINIMDIIKHYPNKNFYLPITKDDIAFVKYNAGDLLVAGPYKTMEPKGDIISRDNIDCFIIPCVGISLDNKRLGYGKGYYDKYLAGYQGLKIGICYNDSCQLDFAADSFDVVLDKVITD